MEQAQLAKVAGLLRGGEGVWGMAVLWHDPQEASNPQRLWHFRRQTRLGTQHEPPCMCVKPTTATTAATAQAAEGDAHLLGHQLAAARAQLTHRDQAGRVIKGTRRPHAWFFRVLWDCRNSCAPSLRRDPVPTGC